MENVQRTKKEYGGFLPLELNDGKEMFDAYDTYLKRFNSVKASINYVVNKLNVRKICLPMYYCPTTIEAIRSIGIPISFYHINNKLLPIDLEDEEFCAVVLVDYFGVVSDEITDIAKTFTKAEVIIDRAHSFFSEPIIKEKVYNIYSAKKFFGIPDGSYLISMLNYDDDEELVYSSEYANYLLTAYEEGTSVAYGAKKDVDRYLERKYLPMSRLSLGLLKNVDYSIVKLKRKENYRFLWKQFNEINELKLPEEIPAHIFPLLISKKGLDIKKELVNNKVYVSTLWNGEELLENGFDFELNMARNAIFLPIDQRYDINDMNYISILVKRILKDMD